MKKTTNLNCRALTIKTSKKPAKPAHTGGGLIRTGRLLAEIRTLIETARQDMARRVNSGLVLLYWQVGHRIQSEILRGKRASYGTAIVPVLSARLSEEYGPGFSEKGLFHMCRFAETFPDAKIVSTLSRQLGCDTFVPGTLYKVS